MQTYSHALMTAGLGRFLRLRGVIVSRALLLGSVMPDIPLALLTLGYWAQRGLFSGADVALFGPDYDALYFGHPFWIASHNVFHAPLITFGVAALTRRRGLVLGERRARALFWFWAGCALHSVVDILTHHHDGPLLLFPFDWELRFQSPVSYWDSRHYAEVFGPLEHLMDVGMIVFLIATSARVRAWTRRLVAALEPDR